MESKFLIIASQDYQVANHKGLWEKLAEISGQDVIVANIPADKVVSKITHHKDRVNDALRSAERISEHLIVYRPLITIRPEVLPDAMFSIAAKEFWKCLEEKIPETKDCMLNIIVYNAFWVKVLKGTRDNIRFAYYLFDEVRYNGKDNSIDKKRYRHDEYACLNSEIVLTMSQILADSRSEYNKNIVVIGNGAIKPKNTVNPSRKFEKSFAFVGNFRDWIDQDLLTGLIEKRQDILFVFAGSVEDNMKSYMDSLLNKFTNTIFFGKVKKEKMSELYMMFDGILIPYKDNDFIKATRPIKIVEAVLAGTPVITIPMNGYSESKFIRFANNSTEFSEQIDFLLSNPIHKDDDEYMSFVENNTWDKKAEIIIKEFDKIEG